MFSATECPSCQKYVFEVEEESPKGSNFKLIMFRCQTCKTAIGVLDYYNIGNLKYYSKRKILKKYLAWKIIRYNYQLMLILKEDTVMQTKLNLWS